MSRRRPRGRAGGTGSRKKSLSRSSDEAEGIGNSVRHREPNRRLGTHGERRHRCRSSSSVDTNDSGSSIESQGDDERTRRRHRRRNRDVGAGLGSSSELIFTRSEETRIIRSLQRKLLSNDGARLSRIERRLLQADPARSGVVSMSTFRAALSKEAKSGNGANIGRDETIWLMENLRGRNGKNVAILKIRGLLDTEEPGVKRRSGVKISEEMEPHRSCRTRRGSTQSNNRSRGTRRRAGGPDTDDGARERLGGGGRTTSESDTSGQGGASLRRRASPAAPARWAIRHGTVGQWLHDVAAPMERKLFFEFIKSLDKFEVRNGLDHYRVRPRARPRSQQGFGDGEGGATRRCSDDDGATVLHLGPMLKASIRFYV